MSDHHVVVTTIGQVSNFAMLCSCGTPLVFENHATLDELAAISHEHIEVAERGPGYETQSAVTSNDDLVDLDARDIRNDTAWTGSTYGV